MNLKSIICSSLILVAGLSASANVELENGGVYRITNCHNSLVMTSPSYPGKITITASNATNPHQLWLAESNADGSGYYLRDIATGTYMTSPVVEGGQWITTFSLEPDDSTMSFILNDSSLENTSIQAVGYDPATNKLRDGYAHGNGSSGTTVICYGPNAQASKWNLTQVNLGANAINSYKENWYTEDLSIKPNRVYHIVNASYGHALTHNGNRMAVCVAANSNDESQLWLTEPAEDGSGYILRNYKSGCALMSSMEISKQWSVANSANPDPSKAVMHFELEANGYTFEPQSVTGYNNDNRKIYGYAHEASNSDVVCWQTDGLPTYWDITPMQNITEADIAAKRNTWDYVILDNIENPLRRLFVDKTCTELNPEYASMSVSQLQQTEAYLALPETLRRMVLKVRTNDWAETDPVNPAVQWDSEHAKKFRVQMIEPYSECDRVANLTSIWAYTNLNNVTGILGDSGTTLYVMVDKGASEGSTLYIAPRTFEDNVDKLNKYTDGIELHEGLNIIPCESDCAQMVVYYTVMTNQGRERLRPLTDFDDIKIHIEGGSINGFFNSVGDELYTPDTNEDWFYYRDRARNPRFCLISEHCMLYLHFDNATDADNNDHPGLKNLLTPEEYAAGNFDLKATMDAWDNMFVAEQLVMGLMSDDIIRAEKAAGRDWYDPLTGDDIAPSDYHLYFNNRLMGITLTTGFMSATWYRTTYNISTLRTIIMEFPTMDLWGPAHEFGHMNQKPMNIAGTTEESNNVFSNIALFYRGDKTSRASLPSVQADFFNKGYNFHQHDTWGTTRMWFQLWLYYHATGHNKKFYPRLYELLRDNPLRKNSTDHLNAKDDLLHFAKMCCFAAGEDLTDFFEAWGFFIPQDGFYINDYTSYTSYLTEEEIAEWKADIAQLAEEKGWEKNTSIIFIDDRVGSTKPGYADWCNPADAGPMGALKDFAPGADTVSGNYEFAITGTTVTVSGATGGVGFIIYDENGKLIGFSNNTTFEVSPSAAEKIAAGTASFNVVTGGNEEIEVVDLIRTGSQESKAEIISKLIEQADAVLAKADFTKRKVGYIKPELVADLKSIRDAVKTVVDNNGLTAENITELYTQLNQEVIAAESIAITPENTIWIEPNSIYAFTYNKLKGERGIKPDATSQTVVPVIGSDNVDIENVEQQWLFIPASDDSTPGYYLQSISSHKYMRIPDADETSLPLSDEPQRFIAEIQSPGFISLAADITDNHKAIHASNGNKIVRWTTGAEASHWTIELIDNAEKKAHQFALSDMIERSEVLLAQSGSLDISAVNPQPVEISGANLFTNAPCTVSGSDAFTDTTWDNLFDNNPTTIFHSDYSNNGTSDGLNHYIRIELPADVEFNSFLLKYHTRKNGNQPNAPTKVLLSASADAENWITIADITSGLESESDIDVELAPYRIPSATRYVRFMVNEANPNSMRAGHPFFAISELRIFNAESVVAAFPAKQFSFVEPEMMLELFDEIDRAKDVLVAESTNEQLASATELLKEKYQTLLDAMNRNSERLRDLIEQTRTIAAEIGTNNEIITPLTLTSDHYSTNAEYTGANTGDRLSSWEVLFDNNPNTFFHSNYDGNTTDGLDHYIRIELPEPTQAEETHMVLTYKTRNQAANTYAPVEAVIEYSADGLTWTTAQELDAVLPVTHATAFESETFEVPAGTAHIRFTVIKNRRSVSDETNAKSNDHAYFAVSEFGLRTYSVVSEPDTDSYPLSNSEDIIAALRQCRNSEIVLNAQNTSHSHYDQSYAALLPHYNTLLAIKESPSSTVSIDEIGESENAAPVIYNLQGLRIQSITSPGIYIINGKKVLIK